MPFQGESPKSLRLVEMKTAPRHRPHVHSLRSDNERRLDLCLDLIVPLQICSEFLKGRPAIPGAPNRVA